MTSPNLMLTHPMRVSDCFAPLYALAASPLTTYRVWLMCMHDPRAGTRLGARENGYWDVLVFTREEGRHRQFWTCQVATVSSYWSTTRVLCHLRHLGHRQH